MKYTWEKKAEAWIANALYGASSPQFRVISVAVANEQTGEAALIKLPCDFEPDIAQADYAKDVIGDAMRHYKEALDAVFPGVSEYGRKQERTHIDDLVICQRTRNGLRAARLYTVADIAAKKDHELLRIPNFGRKSLNDIRAAIEALDQ